MPCLHATLPVLLDAPSHRPPVRSARGCRASPRGQLPGVRALFRDGQLPRCPGPLTRGARLAWARGRSPDTRARRAWRPGSVRRRRSRAPRVSGPNFATGQPFTAPATRDTREWRPDGGSSSPRRLTRVRSSRGDAPVKSAIRVPAGHRRVRSEGSVSRSPPRGAARAVRAPGSSRAHGRARPGWWAR